MITVNEHHSARTPNCPEKHSALGNTLGFTPVLVWVTKSRQLSMLAPRPWGRPSSLGDSVGNNLSQVVRVVLYQDYHRS